METTSDVMGLEPVMRLDAKCARTENEVSGVLVPKLEQNKLSWHQKSILKGKGRV